MNRIRRILSALLLAALLTGALFAFSSSAGLFGDIDGDGGVTYEDAQLLFDYVAGAGRLTVSQLGAADINRDGSVTIADAAMLFHYVSGLFPSLPFEEGEYARLVVQTMPDKTEYIVGEDFDYGGLLVCAEYDGGKRVPLETYTLSALGTSTATGVKIVTVSAGGLQTAFTVTVLPDALTGIELTALPAKRTYVLGETLDLAGLRVNAVYASGTKAQISAYAVDGFDGSRAGRPDRHRVLPRLFQDLYGHGFRFVRRHRQYRLLGAQRTQRALADGVGRGDVRRGHAGGGALAGGRMDQGARQNDRRNDADRLLLYRISAF